MSGGAGLDQAVLELQELAERLRRDCPWDREQTVRTIVPHTVEEAYEVADAGLAGDDAKLADELGDLLFQVVFLSLLLEERGAGDLAAVARSLHAKLVRRHPHVFGEAAADYAGRSQGSLGGPEGRAGRAARGSSTTCPRACRRSLLARKVARRAATVGFDYPDAERASRRSRRRDAELREAVAAVPSPPRPRPSRTPASSPSSATCSTRPRTSRGS